MPAPACRSEGMLPISLPHRLILVRHGETDWTREGRLQGGQDIPLNDLGRRQAAEAAGRLKALEPAYAELDYIGSPMQRARETMDILRRELGLPEGGYVVEDRLRELTFGEWEGFTWRDVRKAEPDLLIAMVFGAFTGLVKSGMPATAKAIDDSETCAWALVSAR